MCKDECIVVPKCIWTRLTILQKPSGLKILCMSIQQMASREADFQPPWSIDSLVEDAKKSRKNVLFSKCFETKAHLFSSLTKHWPNDRNMTGNVVTLIWTGCAPFGIALVLSFFDWHLKSEKLTKTVMKNYLLVEISRKGKCMSRWWLQ